jgi:hypothetical protein
MAIGGLMAGLALVPGLGEIALVVGAYIAYNFYNSKHDGDGITIGFY